MISTSKCSKEKSFDGEAWSVEMDVTLHNDSLERKTHTKQSNKNKIYAEKQKQDKQNRKENVQLLQALLDRSDCRAYQDPHKFLSYP